MLHSPSPYFRQMKMLRSPPISAKCLHFLPIPAKFIHFPCFCIVYVFWLNLRFLLPSILTMMQYASCFTHRPTGRPCRPVCNQGRMQSGASIPSEAMMHFPPVSDFPPIFEKFSESVENFQNFTFSEKFLDFHPPKFLMTFFSPVVSQKLFFPPFKNSPCFRKILLPFTYFMCISF